MSTSIINNLENCGALDQPLHLAIGMFDGMHRGHKAVVNTAIEAAKSQNGQTAVLTFDPHPSRLFNANSPTLLILPLDIKTAIINSLELDYIICQEFTREFAGIEADEFIAFLKTKIPGLSGIYTGENFRFGKGRKGDINTLKATAEKNDIKYTAVERLNSGNEAISSTRIRKLLEDGQIEEANELFGYNYFSSGTVVPGKQLGRSIGFPTLNINWVPELQPKFGVYTVTVQSEAGTEYKGVANYGIKPTVSDSSAPTLEVHILGDTKLDAGDFISVEWHHFIRGELKFNSVDELKAQISKDTEEAIKLLG